VIAAKQTGILPAALCAINFKSGHWLKKAVNISVIFVQKIGKTMHGRFEAR
jgi:hypothetical protein